MSRRHPKRRHANGEHYAMIPVEVMASAAMLSLPNFARWVLMAIAAQYRGNNNGDLALTWKIARAFGIGSKEHLVQALAFLLERGLIVKTRQGGKRPLGPTLYAITWKPIDDITDKSGNRKIDIGPTVVPSNEWARWSTGLPADQSAINQRDCRRGSTGLPADQKTPVSGLPADQRAPFNGTAGSPPSRSPWEGVPRPLSSGNGARRGRHGH